MQDRGSVVTPNVMYEGTIDAWPAVVDVMYAPGLLYKPKPEDAQRFADLAEAGYIGAVEGPHGGFAGYELRKRGWELIVRTMGYER